MKKPSKVKVDDEFDRLVWKHAGVGIPEAGFAHRQYFDASDPWIDALVDVDAFGDKARLIALLRSGEELPPIIRHHLADLLERWRLTRPPGRQRTPSYDRTTSQWVLEAAIERVRADVKAGMSVRNAIDKTANEPIGGVKIDEHILADAYAGRLGAMRFAKRTKRKR